MIRQKPRWDSALAGFTLVEALVSLALIGLIFGALATITAQWLPNWNHGIVRVQDQERLASGLERITADLAASEFFSAERESREVFFDGTEQSVVLVRTAVGINADPGLEVVRIAEAMTEFGPDLVRMRAPFIPKIQAINYATQVRFSDPVVLLRASHQIKFAYAGADRVWLPTWRKRFQLPNAVKVTLHAIAGRRALSVSTATLIHAEASIECLVAASMAACLNNVNPPERSTAGPHS